MLGWILLLLEPGLKISMKLRRPVMMVSPIGGLGYFVGYDFLGWVQLGDVAYFIKNFY